MGEPSLFPGFDRLDDGPERLLSELTRLRRRRGLSQTEVAARMGTSQSALARLESGRSDARLSTVSRYAAALGTTVGIALASEQGERDDTE
jgi:transcriptional regulator with XRE-family HTH domain